MNRAQELIGDALALLQAHGFDPDVQKKTGRHIKVKWVDGGRRHMLVIPRSPGGYHIRKQSRGTLRRLLRKHGVAQ